MNRQDAALLSEIRKVVAREIREVGLVNEPSPRLPVPWPADAEQDILSALLGGHTTVAELDPLRPYHFYATIFQSIFKAIVAGAPATDLPALAASLGERGPVLAELEKIRDTTPFVLPSRLQENVSAVIEDWKSRELLAELARVDRDLRLRLTNYAGVRATLGAYFWGRAS